jgi:hypothetical protein
MGFSRTDHFRAMRSPAADAVQQVDAEGAFQFPHLLGHRRRADVQALGP